MGLSATNNRLILLVGIITCGLADALGNAAGFHVSEETEEYHTRREVWKSTILCFLSTMIVFVILASFVFGFKPGYHCFRSRWHGDAGFSGLLC